MKVIQPFFLGGAGGLALALAIAVGLYLSPLRKSLYLQSDPEISELRDRMDGIQERLVSHELGIAEASSEQQPADSLKSAQAGSWKEYRHWRNRIGELSRMHDRPTPAGFSGWSYSLRYWFFPAAALLSLLPGLFLAVRTARRPKVQRPSRNPARPVTTQAEAFSSFQSAVKQVARISAAEAPAPVPERVPTPREFPAPRESPGHPSMGREAMGREAAGREESQGKETEYLPEVPKRIPVVSRPPEPAPLDDEDVPDQDASPYETASGNVFRDPETTEIPMTDPPTASGRPAGMETQILNLGPGWGEPRRPPLEDAPGTSRTGNPPGLSMQDEDGGDAGEAGDLEEPPSGAFMPPTTEVEKVERRKAEVLKLARKGLTSSEISRRMRISQDQVEFIIRMRREKG